MKEDQDKQTKIIKITPILQELYDTLLDYKELTTYKNNYQYILKGKSSLQSTLKQLEVDSNEISQAETYILSNLNYCPTCKTELNRDHKHD